MTDATGIENTQMFRDIPLEVTVSVGRARPMVRDFLNLEQNAVLTLDRRVDDPVDLYVGGRLVARGQLEEAETGEGNLAVRLTEVISGVQNGL